jgi:hypothetical protein
VRQRWDDDPSVSLNMESRANMITNVLCGCLDRPKFFPNEHFRSSQVKVAAQNIWDLYEQLSTFASNRLFQATSHCQDFMIQSEDGSGISIGVRLISHIGLFAHLRKIHSSCVDEAHYILSAVVVYRYASGQLACCDERLPN